MSDEMVEHAIEIADPQREVAVVIVDITARTEGRPRMDYQMDLRGAHVEPGTPDREVGPGRRFILVVEGDFDISLDGEVMRVGPGGVVHLPRGIPHGFTNVGSTDGRTFWSVMPGESFSQFFDELSAVPPGPPDMEALLALHEKYGIELLPAS